jgi:hypothetical protein
MFGNLGDPKQLGQQLASVLVKNKPIGQLPGDTCGQIQAAILRIIRGSGNENMDENLKQEFITQVMSAAFERFAARPGSGVNHSRAQLPRPPRASRRRSLAYSALRLTTPLQIPMKEVPATENFVTLYHSGEPVLVSGTYAVVGVNSGIPVQQKEKPLRCLLIGENFPLYDGWVVCWYLSEAITLT